MKEEYTKIILDFVEGRTTAEHFWDTYQSNLEFKQAIIADLDKNKLPNAYFDPVEFLNKGINPLSYRDTSNLHGIAKRILKYNNTNFTPSNFHSDRNRLLIKMQPEWLDIGYDNEKFLINLLSKAPKDLGEAQKLKWCKEKLLEYFKYDNKPPRWVQNADWPIKNGKPLVFRGQSKERKESELVQFFFYDPETGEETIIEQYY